MPYAVLFLSTRSSLSAAAAELCVLTRGHFWKAQARFANSFLCCYDNLAKKFIGYDVVRKEKSVFTNAFLNKRRKTTISCGKTTASSVLQVVARGDCYCGDGVLGNSNSRLESSPCWSTCISTTARNKGRRLWLASLATLVCWPDRA